MVTSQALGFIARVLVTPAAARIQWQLTTAFFVLLNQNNDTIKRYYYPDQKMEIVKYIVFMSINDSSLFFILNSSALYIPHIVTFLQANL